MDNKLEFENDIEDEFGGVGTMVDDYNNVDEDDNDILDEFGDDDDDAGETIMDSYDDNDYF